MNTSLLLATFPVKQPHSGRSHPQLTSGTFSEMCTHQKQQNMEREKIPPFFFFFQQEVLMPYGEAKLKVDIKRNK